MFFSFIAPSFIFSIPWGEKADVRNSFYAELSPGIILTDSVNSSSKKLNVDGISNMGNIEIGNRFFLQLILFPECSLSGFTAEMKKCSMEFLKPFLDQIKEVSFKHNVTIIVPSAYVEAEKIYNAVFIFDSNEVQIQYKVGLTESEQKFFSIPEKSHSKIFTTKGIRIGVPVCV